MPDSESIQGISVSLTLDTSQFDAGIRRAKTELSSLQAAANKSMEAGAATTARGRGRAAPGLAVPTVGGVAAPAPGRGGTLPVTPAFTINREVANDLRVSLNRHFNTMSAQGHTVNVQIGLGRTSWVSLRQQIAANIGVVPIQITLSPATAGAGRASIVNILGALASSQYNTTYTQGKQIVVESLHRRGIEARRRGGPVASGRPYLVGEEGPEVYWPSGSGYIEPAYRGKRVRGHGGKYGAAKPLDITSSVQTHSSGYYYHSTADIEGIRGRSGRPGVMPTGWDELRNRQGASYWSIGQGQMRLINRDYGRHLLRTATDAQPGLWPTPSGTYGTQDRLVPRSALQYWGDDNNWHRFRRGRARQDGGPVHARFGMRVVPAPEGLPPPLGSVPLREGYVRGFHATKPTFDPATQKDIRSAKENLDSIRKHGLRRRFGIGETYGEPDAMWFANDKQGYGNYEDMYAVEAHLPARWFDRSRKYRHDPPTIGGPSSNMAVMGDVSPRRFVTYNEPWMRHARYMMDERRGRGRPVESMREIGPMVADWRNEIRSGKPVPSDYLDMVKGYDQFVAEVWRARRRMAGGPVKGHRLVTEYPNYIIGGLRGLGGPEFANMARAYAMKPGALDALRAGIGGLGRSTIMESLDWYPAMGELIDLISSSRGIHPDLLAALTGKFSQNAPWPRNLLSALRFHDQFVGAPGGEAMLQFIDPNFPEKNMGQMKGVFASYAARKAAASLYQRKGNLWVPSGANPLDILTGYKDIAFTRALRGNELAVAIDRFVNYSMGFPQQRAPDAERAAGDMAIREFAKTKLWTPSGTQAAAWYAGGGGKLETQREWEELFSYLGWGPSSPGSKRTRAYHRQHGGPVWTPERGLDPTFSMRFQGWDKKALSWMQGPRMSPKDIRKSHLPFSAQVIDIGRNYPAAESPFSWREEAWGRRGPFLFPEMVSVSRLYQGRGLANALYTGVEKELGVELMPGSPQTMFGKALWAQRNRPFGRSWGAMPIDPQAALELEYHSTGMPGSGFHRHTPDAAAAMCVNCGQRLIPWSAARKSAMEQWLSRFRPLGDIDLANRMTLTEGYLFSEPDIERTLAYAVKKNLLLEPRCAGGITHAKRGASFLRRYPFSNIDNIIQKEARLGRDFEGPYQPAVPPAFLFHQIGPQGMAGAMWNAMMRGPEGPWRTPKAMRVYASQFIPQTEEKLLAPPMPMIPWTQSQEISEEVARMMTLGRLIPSRRKMASGGKAGSGLYVVGEVGDELFVPMTMAHRIPPDVMKQIPGGTDILPRKSGGPVRIGKQGPELFAPPEDGVIVPHHLMNQVKFAAGGATTTRTTLRRRGREIEDVIRVNLEEARLQAPVEMRQVAERISGRTPQGLIAQMMSSTLGGRGRAMAQIAEARAAQEDYFKTMSRHAGVLGGLQAREEKLADTRYKLSEGRGSATAVAAAERSLSSYRERHAAKIADTERATVRLNKAMGGMPGGLAMLQNATSIIGGIAGYGLAMQAFGFAVSSAMPALEKIGDTFLGFAPTYTKVTTALADHTRELGGNYRAALATAAVSAGLSKASYDLIAPQLELTVQSKAGAKAYGEASDLFRASFGAQLKSGPEGLYGGYGGVAGTPLLAEQLGGGKGFIEQIVGNLDQTAMAAAVAPKGSDLIDQVMDVIGTKIVGKSPSLQKLGADLGLIPGPAVAEGMNTELWQANRDALREDLGSALERAETRAGVSQYQVRGVGRANENAVRRLEAAGVEDWVIKLAEKGIILTDEMGNLVTATEELNKGWARAAEGYTIPDIDNWSETVKRALAAEFKSIDVQGALTRELAIPFQFALGRITQPYLAAGAGILPGAAAGAIPKGGYGAAAMKVGATSETASFVQRMATSYNAMVADQNAYAKEAIAKNQEFINSMGGPMVGRRGGMTQSAFDFGIAMSKAQEYSGQIAELQGVIADAQASAAAVSYGNQIRILNRSLRDARGLLTGQGGTRNLGAMQRQQFDIQRESQRLELQLSERRIATQLALARFQAPGETGEERYARQNEAIIEAQIAQKKLTFSQKEFALVLPIFTENARRAAEDARAAINVASTARQAEIKTSQAQQNIAGLTNAMNKELQTAQSILEDANKKQATALGAATDAAKNFGYGFKDVVKRLYQSLGFKVTTGTQGQLIFSGPSTPPSAPSNQTPPAPVGGSSSKKPGNPNLPRDEFATGIVGTTIGPTAMMVGEAGRETVAVLRNPRMNTLGGVSSGNGSTGYGSVVININGPIVRDDRDIDAIASAVERALSRKGQLLGLRSPAF